MFLGSNLQYLRKANGGMTQEKLAEQMGVSRQTVSKWEAGEASPELPKLLQLCEVFSCKLDSLLREDMVASANIYLPVRLLRVAGFRIAYHVVISAQPRLDAELCMEAWVQRSGLLSLPGHVPQRIGWEFPYVSGEQRSRFGLRGYAAASILPDNFAPCCGGAEVAVQKDADYAVMTLRDPFAAGYSRISQAYSLIFEFLSNNGIRKSAAKGFLPCFERHYEQDGAEYMDIFVHCEGTAAASTFRFDM
ncbi:MAG: helix-turn-helix transcriptional regulator [Eubacteriales bacterium]|nr:helix-turn-helix transcriptional regulator [Eubacteriales bacterium]